MAAPPLSRRMDIVEEKVAALEELPARVTSLEHEVKEFRVEVRQEFAAVRGEMSSLEDRLRQEIREGDEETRRYMRVLHEDLVDRLKTLGEGFNPNRH